MTTAPTSATSTTAASAGPVPSRARRLVVLVLVLVVSSGAFATTDVAALNPPQSELAGVVWYVGGGPGSIDEFWARTFGASYVKPGIYFYNGYGAGDYDVPGCGNTSARHFNGFYCPWTRSIYLDYADQTDRISPGGYYTFGDGQAVGFLAHEWGHHVQSLLRLPDKVIASEYHADCLAGMYMRYGYATGRLTGGDYWEFHNWLLSTPASATHGDPVHRTLWYRYGWDQYSLASCQLAFR